jgi:magnesium-transporting ATPase (P-type)
MITAVTLALAIAFEQPEADIMRRRPRDPREPLLSGFLIWRIGFVAALLVAGSLGLFLWEQARGARRGARGGTHGCSERPGDGRDRLPL